MKEPLFFGSKKSYNLAILNCWNKVPQQFLEDVASSLIAKGYPEALFEEVLVKLKEDNIVSAHNEHWRQYALDQFNNFFHNDEIGFAIRDYNHITMSINSLTIEAQTIKERAEKESDIITKNDLHVFSKSILAMAARLKDGRDEIFKNAFSRKINPKTTGAVVANFIKEDKFMLKHLSEMDAVVSAMKERRSPISNFIETIFNSICRRLGLSSAAFVAKESIEVIKTEISCRQK